ncbi:CCA tRNA nucleotidyltransferase [Tabrizicola sp.]|uniref:CCA tRNA nucleotidyltransferase n=1 Tax=Tabrizicola sp. TaxID=2005166 RepID=UPI00286A1078|nr:CCA tRNA nucleotidyltransferase [Tabrizicola sp.]
MKINGKWMAHSGTQALCAALEAAGYKALFVGGCVRNQIIGAPVADIDIATDAVPPRVTEVAGAAGFKVVPTGIDHGTVTVIADGKPHEVTTFRRDLETDGRRAVVAFATDITQDAERRDFTMNALYADRHGTVIDPLGGLADLMARQVRFVGVPEQRIREDYLRILRFFRFHAQYGDPQAGLDADGLAACAALADGLSTLSRERVGAEMKKLLAAPDPTPSLAAMAQSGVLMRLLAGADVSAIAPLVHLEAGLEPRWQRRLVVLGGEKPAERLRLSKSEAKELDAIHEALGSGLSGAALGWKIGLLAATDAVLGRAASLGMGLIDGWRREIERGVVAQFPVTADDLMPALQGANLGQRLRVLEERWLRSDLRLTRGELLG